MDNLRCEKLILSSKFKKFIENSDEFRIYNLQTYFPIMGDLMKYYNNDYVVNNYVLNSQYRLLDFNSKEGNEICCDKGTENYKSFSSCLYDNKSKKKIVQDIFIKLSPILDPTTKMMNQYPSENHNINLPYPQPYNNRYSNRISSTNNSTYIDCFFTFLGSKLVENNLSPNFPLYYGSYCGIAEEYEHDISEEYESYKKKFWFVRGQKKTKDNNPIFSLKFIDDDFEYQNSCSDSGTSNEKDSNSNEENESDDSSYNTVSDSSEDESNKYKNIEKKYNENINNIKENLPTNDCNIECLEIDAIGDIKEINNFKLNTLIDSDNSIKEFNNNFPNTELNNFDLKEIDCDNLNSVPKMNDLVSISSSIKEEKEVYAILQNFPVQMICMEKCDKTFEDILESDINQYQEIIDGLESDDNSSIKKYFYKLKLNHFINKRDYRWKSYILQICFALSVAQKHYNLTHNDLHSSNIMYVPTEDKYIYYKFNNKYYRIPTFGKILKIIDFGRAIFKLNNNEYFSDVFEPHADAGGQYTYPTHRKTTKKVVMPNKSFDLSRLSTSILMDLFPDIPGNKENGKNLSINQKETTNELFNLLYSWIVDKYGKEVTRFDDFNLYKIIARRMTNAVPEKQISKTIFNTFLIDKSQINYEEGKLYNY